MTPIVPLIVAARQVHEALTNPGPRPDVHQAAIAELTEKWPTLAAAVFAVRDAYALQGDVPPMPVDTATQRRWLKLEARHRGPEIVNYRLTDAGEFERLIIAQPRSDGTEVAHLFQLIQSPSIHGVTYRRFRTEGGVEPLELAPGQSPTVVER